MEIDPRREARERVGSRFDVAVLEPAPPACTEPPWFADDPVNTPVRGALPVVTPVSGGDLTWNELAAEEPDLADWCADRWLGAWRPLVPIADLAAFVATRRALHAVAEHVVAPARHRANGKIGLRFTRGGFGTPFFAHDGVDTQVRVEGTVIVVAHGDQVTRAPIAELADATGRHDAFLTPGDDDLGYATATAFAIEAVRALDPGSTDQLGNWFGFACSVLEEVRSTAPDAQATRTQIWPEHFDMSIDLGDDAHGARGTLGASPGDPEHPEPYLYVTHWGARAPDPFWNDTAFDGASLAFSTLVQQRDQRAAALDFFRTGRRVLGDTDA